MLEQCFATPELALHPVFVALERTIRACSLPITPFADLIYAFQQDQVVTHHDSLATLEEYSRYSANPVGRLVLLISGYNAPALMELSDEVCTALQLANFYQDVVEDTARGRRYLPADIMARYGVTDKQIVARQVTANYKEMLEFLVADARARLLRGSALIGLVDRDLAATLALFVAGGHAILDAIAAQGYDTLSRRPVVSKRNKMKLLGVVLLGKLRASLLPSSRRVTA